MKLCCSILALICFASSAFAQTKTWVYLNDKPNQTEFLLSPAKYLSTQAIEKRAKYNINIDVKDIPIHKNYIDELANYGAVVAQSKWLNAVVVSAEEAQLAIIENLPFVKSVVPTKTYVFKLKEDESTFFSAKTSVYNIGDYGAAYNQITALNGDCLHNFGFEGEGITIAVCDNGFTGVDNLEAFEHLYTNGTLKGHYNFVTNNIDVFDNGSHGTNVLSTMAAYLPNAFIGVAANANYYLFKTEDNSSETIMEEFNWIMAAEFADSAGVDIITTSLGYSNFNDSTTSHTYEDMDGNTTPISRAADIAASKGMLVVVSAGNEGRSDWKYITAPSDADSALCIAAVDFAGARAIFSSVGPSSDGDQKPNVAAPGVSVTVIRSNGEIATSNGTSFSGPLVAGMAACLWQALPNKSNMDIFNIIQESASQFNNPDTLLGYGIPNFCNAFFNNFNLDSELLTMEEPRIFPNPINENIELLYKASENDEIEIGVYDMRGKQVYLENYFVMEGNFYRYQIPISHAASAATYLVRIKTNSKTHLLKALKVK